jgi:hypothetical protein
MNAAISTLTLAWSAIRDEFRVRLRGLHVQPWWEQARLLRVMGFGHGFGWNIQQTYNQRRGSNLLLSPLDWLLLEMWADAGIPQGAIERAIHEMFDRRDRAPEPRQINSLLYCKDAVYETAQQMKEASVGTGIDFHFPNRTQRPPSPHTLLLAVPPAGRMTFAAMQSERQVDRVAELFSVGIVFTVYPDAWHKEQARARFGVELEFLDDAPCNGAPCNGLDPEPANPFSLSGSSRLAGRSPLSGGARSRQPFLNQEANGR